MTAVPSSGSLALFSVLCKKSASVDAFFFFRSVFVVSLYSNCVFEFNTESQNLSSNTSLFFFSMKLFFFFFNELFSFVKENKKACLLTEQTNPASVNLLQFTSIRSRTFIFALQRSEFRCKLSSSVWDAAPLRHTHFLQPRLRRISLDFHNSHSVRSVLHTGLGPEPLFIKG